MADVAKNQKQKVAARVTDDDTGADVPFSGLSLTSADPTKVGVSVDGDGVIRLVVQPDAQVGDTVTVSGTVTATLTQGATTLTAALTVTVVPAVAPPGERATLTLVFDGPAEFQ